ncbi:hypothetical protein NE237_007829 [Protea cynaroides]|uniref:Uncharacterized protein n=1 Tax=Protea cynaroides TaxID=273540 RepID=A0A9Q0QWU8_9MAGN|nr:hypothetical protein NE237_007829 [Protea cynaroides]
MIALYLGLPNDVLLEEEIKAGIVSELGGKEQNDYVVVRNHNGKVEGFEDCVSFKERSSSVVNPEGSSRNSSEPFDPLNKMADKDNLNQVSMRRKSRNPIPGIPEIQADDFINEIQHTTRGLQLFIGNHFKHQHGSSSKQSEIILGLQIAEVPKCQEVALRVFLFSIPSLFFSDKTI